MPARRRLLLRRDRTGSAVENLECSSLIHIAAHGILCMIHAENERSNSGALYGAA